MNTKPDTFEEKTKGATPRSLSTKNYVQVGEVGWGNLKRSQGKTTQYIQKERQYKWQLTSYQKQWPLGDNLKDF